MSVNAMRKEAFRCNNEFGGSLAEPGLDLQLAFYECPEAYPPKTTSPQKQPAYIILRDTAGCEQPEDICPDQ